ncbi:MAG: FAD-dependent oxidoreductase, partial [Methyloligellaceae bacterium]
TLSRGPVGPNEANVFRLDDRIFGAIPMGGDRYRLIANQPDVFELLPADFEVGEVFWQSSFNISHRQVETYQKGNVFLAGDAAHVHSPAGGRGMNLGIEDAATLAWLIDEGRTGEYTKRRWPVGRGVLRQTHAQTRLLTSKSPFVRFFRSSILPLLLSSRWVRARQLPEMAGLAAPAPPWLEGSGA